MPAPYVPKLPATAAMLSFPARELPFLSAVGVAVASFWRGAWFMMDAAVFPDDAQSSCAASLVAGFGGFGALHVGLPHLPWSRLAAGGPAARTATLALRGTSLYLAGICNVAAWRGVWMAWDLTSLPSLPARSDDETPREVADERRALFNSGLASHAAGAAALLVMGHATSVLAPPARVGVLSDRVMWSSKKVPWLYDVGLFLKR